MNIVDDRAFFMTNVLEMQESLRISVEQAGGVYRADMLDIPVRELMFLLATNKIRFAYRRE